MSYHNNESELRSVTEATQKFINDRARLEEGLRQTLALCCVPAPDIDMVIASVRLAQFDAINKVVGNANRLKVLDPKFPVNDITGNN